MYIRAYICTPTDAHTEKVTHAHKEKLKKKRENIKETQRKDVGNTFELVC